MTGIDERSQRRLAEFLQRNGYIATEVGQPEEALKIYKDNEYICSFMPDKSFRYNAPSDEADKIMNFVEQNLTNYTVHDYLPSLQINGVEKYKVYQNATESVLAGRMMSNDTIEYVTWEYNYDRTGVVWGHYFGEDYTAAKEDFAVRAGLIDKNKLFSEKELRVLYSNLLKLNVLDDNINNDERVTVGHVMDKIEDILPDLKRDDYSYEYGARHEQEDELEIGD